MAKIELPKSIDSALENATGKVTGTAGDLLDAGLTYVGRNILKKYKYDKADEQFQLMSYKQAQDHALKLQEIKNQEIQDYYGEFIKSNIMAIARKALQLAEQIPEEKVVSPNIGFISYVLEEGKYTEEEELRTLFSCLLSKCIDIDYTSIIHPSFIEKIKQLSLFDLKVLDFISRNPMFFSTLHVEVIIEESDKVIFPHLCLFTNMHDFDGDSRQVNKSIDLLISLGILEVDRKEMYSAEEYASRLAAFREQDFESTYKSDLLEDYTELCIDSYYDDYEGTLYNHDRIFYGIEFSPELEKLIRNNYESEDRIEIESISSVRRIIKFTSYGHYFKKAISK